MTKGKSTELKEEEESNSSSSSSESLDENNKKVKIDEQDIYDPDYLLKETSRKQSKLDMLVDEVVS